jgi:DNA excision repair protein ERCC-2
MTEFPISVREMVEYVHRAGNLAGESGFRPANRAVEGSRAHRRLQAARGDAYQAEVPVSRTFERHGLRVILTGRVDGLLAGSSPPMVEEIKSVDARWPGKPDAVHLAQLRTYAALLAVERGWKTVEHRLTYVDLDTELETTIRDTESDESLAGFLDETLHEWFAWLVPRAAWLKTRNESLADLPFPFSRYRAGQRDLAKAVYRSLRDKRNLFVEAPTGLGKTLATLFPAVKTLPLLADGQIFYVTAKTSGRLSAGQALEKLRRSGARLKSVTLTAKRKICFSEDPAGCDPRTCPFAIGYYDRIKPAVRELLEADHLDRALIESTARAHQVCPFELSLDASLWTDVVVGDFNHVFDPTARLQRHFGEGPVRHVVLVDEAHNLVDRSRDMYSASLSAGQLSVGPGGGRVKGGTGIRRALAEAAKTLTDWLRQLSAADSQLPAKAHHDGAIALEKPPRELVAALKRLARQMETFLAAQRPGQNLSGWLLPWFELSAFLRAVEAFDDTCHFIADPPHDRITVFCADPSARLAATLKGLRSAVFFSATLTPMEYFVSLLGGDEQTPAISFDSPFLADQMRLRVLTHDVTFKGRAESLPAVAEAVARHILGHPGNHLVFCPSLQYLGELENHLAPRLPGLSLHLQAPAMDESQRSDFLARFLPGSQIAALAVLGGVFAEGVDLPGDRLVGVTVVGVGLPRLSLERDILQAHFEMTRGEGFDFAYRFPGMQRVLQAVGRLIRTENDTGAALLIDSRFREPRYRALFPNWWKVG